MSAPHQQANPTVYVVGFTFTTRYGYPSVYLIEKQKPDWQRGLLNGIGGKVEAGETPLMAMVREYFEETGALVEPSGWVPFHVMRFANGAVVHCFTAHVPDEQTPATQEAELIDLYPISNRGSWFRRSNVIPNLVWLIPMAWHELHAEPGERMVVG